MNCRGIHLPEVLPYINCSDPILCVTLDHIGECEMLFRANKNRETKETDHFVNLQKTMAIKPQHQSPPGRETYLNHSEFTKLKSDHCAASIVLALFATHCCQVGNDFPAVKFYVIFFLAAQQIFFMSPLTRNQS